MKRIWLILFIILSIVLGSGSVQAQSPRMDGFNYPGNAANHFEQSQQTRMALPVGNLVDGSHKTPLNILPLSGGPDTYGYAWDDTETFSWIDASAGTNTGMSGYDDFVGPISLPFSFRYYNVLYNNIYIAANGYITFANWGTWPAPNDIPDPETPNNMIAPYWSRIYIPAGASVRYLSGGTAPNRYFVVEWHDVTGGLSDFGADELYRFEVILRETGQIIFQYHTMAYNGDNFYCDVAGIENVDGTDGLNYLPYCQQAVANTAVLFYRINIFADVPMNYWAWSWVESLYSAGITGGCATTPELLYCPDNKVDRAQMAIFLLRGIHGSSYTPPAVGTSTGFTDVPVSHWAAAWIKQLAAEGITGGCGTNLYCPSTYVTRAQMAIFLLRGKYGSSYTPPAVGTGTGFNDVPISYWAAAWIKQLAVEGITSGCGTNLYCPDSSVTRAQMAIFLVRTFNLP